MANPPAIVYVGVPKLLVILRFGCTIHSAPTEAFILRLATSACIVFLICSLAAVALKGPESKPVAEGDYAMLQDGQPVGSHPLEHWRMYLLSDGSFTVDVEIKTVSLPATAEEHLTYTKDMRLTGYDWVMQQSKTESASIHCHFTDTDARCSGKTLNGQSFSTSLAIKAPYSFMPITDEAIFDLPWSFQAMVWQAERSVNHSTPIKMITLGDADTENGTVLKSALDQPFGSFRYVGRDIADIANQKINAHKFEVRGGGNNQVVVLFWFSDSGLLLKMASPDIASSSIILSSYQGPAL